MNKEKKPTLNWIQTRAPWDAWGTFTFRGGKMPSLEAEWKVNNFLQAEVPSVTYFYVIEKHKPNGAMKRDEVMGRKPAGYHAHLLYYFGEDLTRKLTTNVKRSYTPEQARAAGHSHRWMPYNKLWKKAFKRFGRCDITPFRDLENVTQYLLKRVVDYQTKEVECAEHGLRYGNGYLGRCAAKDAASGVFDEDRILQVGTP